MAASRDAEGAAFLRRLRAASAADPSLEARAGAAEGSRLQPQANPTTNELLAKFAREALSGVFGRTQHADATPRAALAPVLAGTRRLLWRWLRPWLGLALVLAAACSRSVLLGLAALAVLVPCASDWQLRRSLWHSGAVRPGLHFLETARNRAIAARFRAARALWLPRAERELTPWLWNGDLQTLYPFLTYGQQRRAYERVWIEATDAGARGVGGGGERVALDIALPERGLDPSRPLALITHGLNGGSAEAYVLDFVAHACEALGWTCAVLVARGLGGTPIRSGELFHGARTADLAAACALLRAAAPDAALVGVGFSMGAVVLANYCGVSGAECPLACAVAVSGCYDCVANARFEYSQRMWQPWLTQQLKTNYLLREPHATFLRASGRVDVAAALGARVSSITDFDAATVVPYQGYAHVDEYYADMSVAHARKLERVAVPLLALHACDDPIVDSDSYADSIARAKRPEGGGNEHCWFLMTARGGHVGWCLGANPGRQRWNFIHRSVVDFAHAVLAEPFAERADAPPP